MLNDVTPAAAGTGLYTPATGSKYCLPEGVVGSSLYQVGPGSLSACGYASSRSTLAAIGAPAARIFSVVAPTSAASNSSNGPSSQLNPVFIASSISTIDEAISGTR